MESREIYLKDNKRIFANLENDLADALDNANEIISELIIAVNECKDGPYYKSALGLNLWKITEIQSQIQTARQSFSLHPLMSTLNGHNFQLVDTLNKLYNRFPTLFKQILFNHIVANKKAFEQSDIIPVYVDKMDYKECFDKYGYAYLTHIADDNDLIAIKKKLMEYTK